METLCGANLKSLQLCLIFRFKLYKIILTMGFVDVFVLIGNKYFIHVERRSSNAVERFILIILSKIKRTPLKVLLIQKTLTLSFFYQEYLYVIVNFTQHRTALAEEGKFLFYCKRCVIEFKVRVMQQYPFYWRRFVCSHIPFSENFYLVIHSFFRPVATLKSY